MTDPSITLDEVWSLWRIENPTDDEHTENVASVNAAVDDYKNGDRGRPAGELTQELRKQLASNGDVVNIARIRGPGQANVEPDSRVCSRCNASANTSDSLRNRLSATMR